MMTTVVDWVKQRSRMSLVLMCLFCIILGSGLAMIYGRAQTDYWLIYCGNTQPVGQCAPDFVNGGWVAEGDYTAITWQADISQGTARETDAAMAAGHAAYDQHCRSQRCIIAGFSLGNSPALQLSAEVGLPHSQTYLFAAPQPSTGIWHHYAPDNPFVAFWIQQVGDLNESRAVAPGMQAFYGSRDPYANFAPQCTGPGMFVMTLDDHRIIRRDEADEHVWTGTDGVVMHEAGYVAPPSFPRSGSDPSQPQDFCPASGWNNLVGEVPAPFPGPGAGPTGVVPPVVPGGGANQAPPGQVPSPTVPNPTDFPSVPGAPGNDGSQLPIPGGSPIPSQEGNMPFEPPAVPGLPALPGAPG